MNKERPTKQRKKEMKEMKEMKEGTNETLYF
jgi:hypothetical protein